MLKHWPQTLSVCCKKSSCTSPVDMPNYFMDLQFKTYVKHTNLNWLVI